MVDKQKKYITKFIGQVRFQKTWIKKSKYVTKTQLGVVHKIVKDIINGEKLSVYNKAITIDLGHAKDYVEAMWLTLQQEKSDNYIISSGYRVSVGYILDHICDKLDLDFIDDLDSKPLFEARGDAAKLKSIGWKPKYKVEDILDELIEHYKNENIH